MKVYKIVQGTPEWLNLRCGIPTASQFDNIITPKGKPSASEEKYLFGLLAERIMRRPRIEAVSTWMNRGADMEDEAVSFYELQRDCETDIVGFICNDEHTIGASPDRLVGEDGLLEIKVPAEHTHVAYLLKKAVDQTYYPQVQGQLWVSGRKWLDILSYHPEMPPALIRVERDEEYIRILRDAVESFAAKLEGYTSDLIGRGWILSDWRPDYKVPPAQNTSPAPVAEAAATHPPAASKPLDVTPAAPEFLTRSMRQTFYQKALQNGWNDDTLQKLLAAKGITDGKKIPITLIDQLMGEIEAGTGVSRQDTLIL